MDRKYYKIHNIKKKKKDTLIAAINPLQYKASQTTVVEEVDQNTKTKTNTNRNFSFTIAFQTTIDQLVR